MFEVAEEETVAGAEVVAALYRGVERQALVETVFGTSAKTEVGHIAMQAHTRQTVEFELAKPTVGLHHLA